MSGSLTRGRVRRFARNTFVAALAVFAVLLMVAAALSIGTHDPGFAWLFLGEILSVLLLGIATLALVASFLFPRDVDG